ncbi:MAG: diguanylate cyclase [Actinobacteria bacterium]|nr:diguanylate cyclase [Actinomycetota bacterium]
MPRARIVIAEDSLVMRAIVRQHLEDHGYEVIEADDGNAALEACRTHHPDAALLDIEMPARDGHEVLRLMKADDDMADIPVVFLTGRTGTDDIVTGIELGAHDYLKKPFEPPELIARVNSAVRVKRLQDELRDRNAELETVSRTDALTGLYNRRHAAEHLVRHVSSARRHGLDLSVLMFDIDHFKAINDTYGHAGGDMALREFAARLSPTLRTEDIPARWGGEEFLVIAPMTSADGATALGERVRASIAGRPFSIGPDQTCVVTVSVGCATIAGEDADGLIGLADVALYRAKAAGRNQVVSAA